MYQVITINTLGSNNAMAIYKQCRLFKLKMVQRIRPALSVLSLSECTRSRARLKVAV